MSSRFLEALPAGKKCSPSRTHAARPARTRCCQEKGAGKFDSTDFVLQELLFSSSLFGGIMFVYHTGAPRRAYLSLTFFFFWDVSRILKRKNI